MFNVKNAWMALFHLFHLWLIQLNGKKQKNVHCLMQFCFFWHRIECRLKWNNELMIHSWKIGIFCINGALFIIFFYKMVQTLLKVAWNFWWPWTKIHGVFHSFTLREQTKKTRSIDNRPGNPICGEEKKTTTTTFYIHYGMKWNESSKSKKKLYHNEANFFSCA